MRGGASGRRAYLAERWSNVLARFRPRSDAYEQAIWGVLTPRMQAVLAAHARAGDAYTRPSYTGPIALLKPRG